jgi:hypothetical protein
MQLYLIYPNEYINYIGKMMIVLLLEILNRLLFYFVLQQTFQSPIQNLNV